MAALAALLAAAGVPWYGAMLEEAGINTPEDLRGVAAAEALADVGVESRHVTAILDALRRREDAAEAARGAVTATVAAAAPRAATSSGAACPAFTRGGLYDAAFLAAAAPLYEQHMGAENMGPLLYSLVRFAKPRAVLELGAGFTSLFLLQALADNAAECAAAAAAAAAAPAGVPWLTPAYAGGAPAAEAATLHVVDNCAHEHTSAHRVAAAADALDLRHLLSFHDADALDADLPSTLAPRTCFGIVWIDLGAAHRLRALVDAWWPRVDPEGGLLLVHSTLTNEAGRAWLAHMRAASHAGDAEEAAAGPDAAAGLSYYGRFEILSLLEPHKRMQNSTTLLRRRGGGPGGAPRWDEPVYSKWP